MSLEPMEQLKKNLDDAKRALILISENPSGDALGGAIALYFFLSKENVKPEIVYSGWVDWDKYKFIDLPENMSTRVLGARDFVLSFNTKNNKIIDVKTEENDGEYRIYITPEVGAIDPRDFSFIPAKFKYDLVFVIGAADLEQLGKVYEENSDLFFEVPVVNIDNKSDNEEFGKINIVNMTASSCSEMIYGVIEKFGKTEVVDKNIGNALLSGIISSTNSFQKKNTTPKSFLVAAQLMDKGADQQEIIRWMYKTQPLSALKLWGRVMARLNWDERMKLAWSLVSIEDFVQSRSKYQDLPNILEKVKENYDSGEMFMVIYNETNEKIAGMIKFKDKGLLTKFRQYLGGKVMGDILNFEIENGNIIEVEKNILEKIRKISKEKE